LLIKTFLEDCDNQEKYYSDIENFDPADYECVNKILFATDYIKTEIIPYLVDNVSEKDKKVLMKWTKLYRGLFEITNVNKETNEITLKDYFTKDLFTIYDLSATKQMDTDLLILGIIIDGKELSGIAKMVDRTFRNDYVELIKSKGDGKSFPQDKFTEIYDFEPMQKFEALKNIDFHTTKMNIKKGFKLEQFLDFFEERKDFEIMNWNLEEINANIACLIEKKPNKKKGITILGSIVDEFGNQTPTSGSINIDKNLLTISTQFKDINNEIKNILLDNFKQFLFLKCEETTNFKKQNKKPEKKAPIENEEEISKEFLKKHYLAWCDKKIPALNNMTPKEALKSELKEEVIEMIKDIKHNDGKEVADVVKKELNLF